MGNQIALTIIYLIALVFLLVFTELIYKRLGLKGEVTRKIAHFTGTLSTITFPYIYTSHWYVFVLAVFFFLLLFISKRGTRLRSIHDITRKSFGSYLLPVSIYLTFFISYRLGNKFYFILPILILAISDPAAGLLGLNIKQYNHKIKLFGNQLQKTTLGSVSFLVSSFFISIIAIYFHRMSLDINTLWLALSIAVAGTVVELFSWRGTDNLFIPMTVLIILVIFPQ
jgi:phytol kinase